MRIAHTEHQEKLIGEKKKGGGNISQCDEVREALRHSLRSPMKKYARGHFAALGRNFSKP
jgi:hypothetical protein